MANPSAWADIQRARILEAMADAVCERGFAGASVSLVCARAKVSSRTFYAAFDSREDCFLTVLDDGYRRIAAVVSRAFKREERWQFGVRAALGGLLSLLDSEPMRARVWLIESLCAGRWALECREWHMRALASTIAPYWPVQDDPESRLLATIGAMASVAGIVQSHLIGGDPRPTIVLLPKLLSFLLAPYLDAEAVSAEIGRAEELARAIPERRVGGAPMVAAGAAGPVEIPAILRDPRAHRVRCCLQYLSEHPGASNREVAEGIGVARHTQISTLLSRLAGMALIVKQPSTPGHPNAWTLTSYGMLVSRLLPLEMPTAQADGIA